MAYQGITTTDIEDCCVRLFEPFEKPIELYSADSVTTFRGFAALRAEGWRITPALVRRDAGFDLDLSLLAERGDSKHVATHRLAMNDSKNMAQAVAVTLVLETVQFCREKDEAEGPKVYAVAEACERSYERP